MATLLTQERLELLLLGIDPTLEESDIIEEWTGVWSDYFSAASLSTNTEAVASYVVDQGTTLKIGVNSYLGASDLTGSSITVICNPTGASEILTSQFDTQNYVVTTGLLGQETPSTTIGDYTVITTFTAANITTLEGLMAAELAGITGADQFKVKLSAGINAWWDELASSPSTYFTGATLVSRPSGMTLSGLEDSIQDAIDANNIIIASTGNITSEEAMENIAKELNDANTGGSATVGGTPYTIG